MTRTVVRAGLSGVLSAFLGAALLALFYTVHPAIDVEFDRDLPRLIGGVYAPERHDPTRLTFAWTGPEMVLRLPGLDRRVDWQLELRVRAAREDVRTNPELTFFADGVLLETRSTGQDFEDMRITIPARPERRRDATITMRVSQTFTPGPADQRALGVMLDRVRLSSSGIVLPPRRAFAGASASAGILGVAIALLGVTASAAVLAAIVIGAGCSALLARGFAAFTTYWADAIGLALWTAVLLVVCARVIEWRNGQPLRNTARFALAFSAFAAFVKLLVLLHPDMPIGDALFHAHRFRLVESGTYVFTSIAPGNYQFPYAPGLYVTALPFADMVRRDTGDMTLLRIIVMAFDAVAAALLYLVVVRAWGDRLAGALAVALYHLTPLDFRVATVGNLTNAFAQAIAVYSLALMASPGLRLERAAAVAGLVLLFAAAFMSHTSTFAILFPAAVVIGLLFLWRGGPALKSPGYAIWLAALAAAILAVAVYYRHFGEVYRAEWARISAETTAAAPDAGGRTAGDRLAAMPLYINLYFGIAIVALGIAGAIQLWRRGSRDRLTLAIAGWSVACLAFLVIGILTPVDMRYYLTFIPALAVTAASGASWMWTSGGTRRAAALGLLVWAAITGAVGVLSF